MEERLLFQMVNFVPREGVESAVNHQLAMLAERVPTHPGLVARIERRNDIFNFIISLRTVHNTFESQINIDTRELRCRERLWQIKVVRELAEKITGQIVEWRKNRFAA